MRKKRKLNNKGYMLIEIILASAIAFALAYFMLELTLKVKDRNDYLLAATLTATDKAILSNKIMETLKSKEYDTCNSFEHESGVVANINALVNDYRDKEFKLNKYAELGNISSDCRESTTDSNDVTIHIKLPLKIKNSTSNDFDIDLYYLG